MIEAPENKWFDVDGANIGARVDNVNMAAGES
jgi:hypothetical protein